LGYPSVEQFKRKSAKGKMRRGVVFIFPFSVFPFHSLQVEGAGVEPALVRAPRFSRNLSLSLHACANAMMLEAGERFNGKPEEFDPQISQISQMNADERR
jgi:hypothetical protein